MRDVVASLKRQLRILIPLSSEMRATDDTDILTQSFTDQLAGHVAIF